MQDERKNTTLADPICVKLFEREDPLYDTILICLAELLMLQP